MALSVDQKYEAWLADGKLAEVELLGKNPRPLLESVREADWIPGSAELAVVRRVEGRDRVEFPLGKVVYESKGCVSHARVSPDGVRVAFLDHSRYGDNRGRVSVATRDGKITLLGDEWISAEGLDGSAHGREIWFTAVGAALVAAPRVPKPRGESGVSRKGQARGLPLHHLPQDFTSNSCEPLSS